MKGLLSDIEKIESKIPELNDPDDKRLLQMRVAQLYDKVADAAKETRKCPGPYWRRFPTGEGGGKRRRNQTCSNQFTKFYIGPPRDGCQVICDACGQIWARDKKKN